jgi:hypothetical protein
MKNQNVDGAATSDGGNVPTEIDPLFNYDPPAPLSPTGLEALMRQLSEIVVALVEARGATAGCTTRLNLNALDTALAAARAALYEATSDLILAAESITTDAPLAVAFPSRDEDYPYAEHWTSPADSMLLTPRQITYLASLASANPDEPSTTYREALFTCTETPPVAARRLQEIEDVAAHQRALTRPCPRCEVQPGEECLSASGRVTTMHAGRRDG